MVRVSNYKNNNYEFKPHYEYFILNLDNIYINTLIAWLKNR